MPGQIKRLASFLLLFVSLSGVSFAQLTTGDVVGTVTDASGAIVPAASVTLTNIATGVVTTVRSAASGEFTFPSLIPGPYRLSVEAPGFKKLLVANFQLAAGDRLRENTQLETGSVEETVEVTTASPLLQTDSSTVQSTITEKSVQDIPLNGRNFIGLVQVQPGVNAGQANSISSGTRADDRRQSSSVSANGQSDLFNNQLLDGLDNNEREQGFIGVRPSIDAIAEVQVQTNNFSAEVGRSSGAVINIITKSGTNDVHGTVYEFFRNDIFDSRDYFAAIGVAPKPVYRQNQFGGSIGGPIRKNKTFFFADAEETRIIQGLSSGLMTVPTLYEQQHVGDFSDIGGPNVSFLPLDPVGRAYFSMFPKPNISSTAAFNNFSSVVKRKQNGLSVDGRVDNHFNNGDIVFGRYSYNNVNTDVPGFYPGVTVAGVTIQPGGGTFSAYGKSTTEAHSAQLSYTHSFTPQLLMELKAGYTRIDIQSHSLNDGVNASSAIGLMNVNTPAAPHTSGLMPLYFLSGAYAAPGDSPYLPIINLNNNFMYSGSLLYSHGAHSVKAGVQVVQRQLDYFQSVYPLALTVFAGITGNPLTDLLLGQPTGYNRSNLLVNPQYRAWESGYFAQDNWRVSDKLTINLGLRYDVYTPISEVDGHYSNFDFAALHLITGAEDSHFGIDANYKNIAPRVGFSASLNPKTVLRGGYGISYYPLQIQIQAQNPPYSYANRCIPCFGTFKWPSLPVPTPSSVTNLSGSLFSEARNHNTGSVQQFNLILQQQYGSNVFTIGGIGELGRHANYLSTANLPAPAGPYPNTPDSGPGLPATYTTTAALPNVSAITRTSANATSNYYALNAVFARRFTKGLEFNANYTWAHGLGNSPLGSGGVTSPDIGLVPANPRYDYGNSPLDIRSRIAAVASYNLPFGENAHGLTGVVTKGWSANFIVFWQTGQPFTVINNFSNRYGLSQINLPGITSDRPDMIAGASSTPPNRSLTSWFNLSSFTPQAAGTPGNERIYQYYGPHLRRADLSLFKTFGLSDRVKLQFRAEAYNISNTPNFNVPNSTIVAWSEGPGHSFYRPVKAGDTGYCTAAQAGCVAVGLLPGDKPTSAGGLGTITSTVLNINPRQFQFALKLLF